ncbi:hypothetical protein Dimus_014246 [Dionaea muscipula]
MTRNKVKLAYITNDSARKATYKKRKKGFLKKLYELTTLCEIKACAAIYGPYDAQPEVWPSSAEAQQVLAKFRRMPEMEKTKKMMNQEEFLRQRFTKATEQLKKLQKDNREKEMTQVMYQCLTGKSTHNLNMADLSDLGWLIDQNLKVIYKRLEDLKEDVVLAPPFKPANKLQVFDQELVLGGYDIMGFDQGIQRQQLPWYMDLMNPHEQMCGFGWNAGGGSGRATAGGGGGDGESKMIMTFADYSNTMNPLLSSAFFP